MQELAYSTYCSLKHLSRQGYLFQESHRSDGIAFYLWRGRFDKVFKFKTHKYFNSLCKDRWIKRSLEMKIKAPKYFIKIYLR
jgi:hypothetical protein